MLVPTETACRWVGALPDIFQLNGLTQVSVSRVQESLALSRMFMNVELVLAEEFAANSFDAKGLHDRGDEVRALVQAAHVEAQQGATIRHTLQVVRGRKGD